MKTSVQLVDKIYVIQSLAPDDKKTGTSLVEDILVPIGHEQAGMGCAFYEVGNAASFARAMGEIRNQAARAAARRYPLLHLEMHGLVHGTGLVCQPTGEVVPWAHFAEMCRGINIACANNLLVSMTACNGFKCLPESIQIIDAVPFCTLVGPEVLVTTGQIEAGFIRMFTALFQEVPWMKP